MRTLRPVLRLIGAPFRAALIGGIRLYQVTLSGALGSRCRFHPSCSQYALEAIRIHGAARGSGMALWRVLRCQPFGHGGFEPVPPRRAAEYDQVIHRPGEARA